MLEQLLLHIERHQLCKTTDKILLAVSGGVDSMAMLDLLHKAGFRIGVAHCNFQLRGNDSLADEALVKQVCSARNIAFHSTRFNTNSYAEGNNLSIQLAARQLRYDFFEKLRSAHGYDWIATAHHLNDSIETVLLNLTKGTGIKGLAGIPVKNNRIIRPLLFASRDEILNYAMSQNLQWREDTSNEEDDYQRNFLRHHVIPRLKQINPNLEATFSKTIDRISGAVEMTESFLRDFKSSAVKREGDHVTINLNDLKKQHYPHVLLWEMIKDNGFNFDQCCDIIDTRQSGKQFLSSTHRLVVDRGSLIIARRDPDEILDVLIEADQHRVSNGVAILQLNKHDNGHVIDKSAQVAQLDASRITFPLRWRKWQAGDAFRPLGMTTHKKVSDLLVDLKVSTLDKEKVSV
ncbi:MAG TPA: tRNA lysidine(34) synthetase TilS, partial [Chryseosolibacter sp.]